MVEAFIVGVDKLRSEDKVKESIRRFRVIECNINGDTWNYAAKMMNEHDFVRYAMNTHVHGLTIKNGKVSSMYGSLDRFTEDHKQIVIFAEIVNSEGKVLGYRVCNYNGAVKNMKSNDVLDYCNKVRNAGIDIPIQNAIFVADGEDRGQHIRTYPNDTFLKCVIATARKKRQIPVEKITSVEEDNKSVKLSNIYTEEQIEQLKIGKRNGVNIKAYSDPKLSSERMEIIRVALEKGAKTSIMSNVANTKLDIACMRFLANEAVSGSDISDIASEKYSLQQLFVLSSAIDSGVDISKMLDPSLKPSDMEEILERLEHNIWKDEFLTKDGSWN